MKSKLGTITITMLVILAMLQAAVASKPVKGWHGDANIPNPQNAKILDTYEHAFIWSNTTGMQDLGTLPGGTYSWAYGINICGQVAGYSSDASENSHAVMWEKVGTNYVPTDLGTLPGGTYSWAYGINDRGQVVGSTQ
jgi:probable HAF family extracellular repeat protein